MPGGPRITDLSAIGPESFKIRNTAFLDDPDEPYELRGEYDRTRQYIWSTRNGSLRRLLREFPIDEPLVDQCAHWMHAVVGKHFFRDANHRTAMFVLRRLLRANEIELGNWPEQRVAEASRESHRVRYEIESVRVDSLYRRDELFEVWRRFFEEVLSDE